MPLPHVCTSSGIESEKEVFASRLWPIPISLEHRIIRLIQSTFCFTPPFIHYNCHNSEGFHREGRTLGAVAISSASSKGFASKLNLSSLDLDNASGYGESVESEWCLLLQLNSFWIYSDIFGFILFQTFISRTEIEGVG